MKIHKLAGLDLGSNSVRLLISNVIENEGEQPIFKKSSLTRLPIRLGVDAFGEGEILPKTVDRLVSGMQAYSKIMEVHGVELYRACATSALREASNGPEIIKKIKEESDIQIDLISGKEEAEIIFSTGMTDLMLGASNAFLYIDVGGGSTEFTLFHNQIVIASKSFKIGTIRLLKNQVAASTWQEMQAWVEVKTKGLKDIVMVGSGGNINRTFKLSGMPMGTPLDKEYIEKVNSQLLELNVDQRIIQFDLNPDRADVITHALKIYLSAMKWAKSVKMTVPKKGLADGIVRSLYKSKTDS